MTKILLDCFGVAPTVKQTIKPSDNNDILSELKMFLNNEVV